MRGATLPSDSARRRLSASLVDKPISSIVALRITENPPDVIHAFVDDAELRKTLRSVSVANEKRGSARRANADRNHMQDRASNPILGRGCVGFRGRGA